MARTIFDDFGITFDVAPAEVPDEPTAPPAEHPSTVFDDFGITFDEPVAPATPFEALDRAKPSAPAPAPAAPRTVFDDFNITFEQQPDISAEDDDLISWQTLESAGRGVASAVVDMVATTPSTLMEALGTELRDRNLPEIAGDWVKFGMFWMPVVNQIAGHKAEELASWITGIESGEDPGKMQQAFGDMLAQWGGTSRKYWESINKEHIQPDAWWDDKKVWDNPEVLFSPTWWAYNLGSLGTNIAATMLPAVGAAKAVKLSKWAGTLNPKTASKLAKLGSDVLEKATTGLAERRARAVGAVVGGTAGGTLEGSGTYRSVIEAGGSPEEARRAAQLQFLFTGGLNAISVGKWLDEPAKRLYQRLLQRLGKGTVESITEMAEEPAEAVAMVTAKMENGEIPEDQVDIILDAMTDSLDVGAPSLVLGLLAPLGGKKDAQASLERARRIFGQKQELTTEVGKSIADQDLAVDQLQATRDRMTDAAADSEILSDLDKLIDTKVKEIQGPAAVEAATAIEGVPTAAPAAEAEVELPRIQAPAPPGGVVPAAEGEIDVTKRIAMAPVEKITYTSAETGEAVTVPERMGGEIETAQTVFAEEYGGEITDLQETRTLRADQVDSLAVADGMGSKVTFYSAKAGSVADGVNGFFLNGRTYLNSNNQDPTVAVLGHESFHELKVKDRKAFDSLMELVKTEATNLGEYMLNINNARVRLKQEPLSEQDILEEFSADIVGTQFTKKDFWKKVDAHDATLGKKLAQIINNLIESIKAKLSGTHPAVKHADQVQDAIASVYADIVKKEKERKAKRAKQPTVAEKFEPTAEAVARQKEVAREKIAAKIKETEEALAKPTEKDVVIRALNFFWDMYDAGEITEERLMELIAKAPAVKFAIKQAGPEALFEPTKKSLVLPVKNLVLTEDVDPDKISRARFHMLEALAGRGKKRQPIFVFEREGDGATVVLDGNATINVMREFGLDEVIAHKAKAPAHADVVTIDDLYTQGDAVRSEFEKFVDRIAKELGAKSGHRPGVKKRSRVQEKADDYGHPRYVKDLVASSIYFKDKASVRKAAERLAKEPNIVEIEDRLEGSKDGYRDMVVMVRDPENGYLQELLLIEEAIQAVKDNTGHQAFEAIRMLDQHGKIDPTAYEFADELRAVSKRLYEHYVSSNQSLAMDFALDSEISRAFINVLSMPSFELTSISLSPSNRKILDDFLSTLKGTPSITKKRVAITVAPPFTFNIIRDPLKVKQKVDFSIKKSRLNKAVWNRKLANHGPDMYTIHEAGNPAVLFKVKQQLRNKLPKWYANFEDSQMGKVNNRLVRELDVFEQIFGPVATAKMLPGKLEGKKRPLARGIIPYDFLLEFYRVIDNGDLAQVMDRTKTIKKIAIERGIKGAKNLPGMYSGKKKEAAAQRKRVKQGKLSPEAWGFLDKVYMLREGSLYLEVDETGAPILSNNGKAGMSTDLSLSTCHPTTPCKECYAAGMTRQNVINKAIRNTLHILADPKDFGRRVAAEAAKVPKESLAFLRLQGSGDIITSEQVIAYNEIAKHADRPIQIFSRHHDMLRKLKGTSTAPFIKMGSIDADLVKHYGLKYLQNNTKFGIANAFLYTDPSELKDIQKLLDNEALNLILSADSKLHETLPLQAQKQSCPCDADERSYQESCRQCALSYMGCFMAFMQKGVDKNGKVWDIADPTRPKKIYPVLQFLQGVKAVPGWSAEATAYSRVAQDVIQKSINLIKKIYLPDFLNKKKPRKTIPLKDIRWPDDVVVVDNAEAARAYMQNLELMKEAAALGTFYLPGGTIQAPIAFKDGEKLADATVITEEKAKKLAFSVKRSTQYGVGKDIGGAVYVHRSHEHLLPGLDEAKEHLPEGFSYDVVKYNKSTKGLSFIQVPGFNTQNEPEAGDGILVRADGSTWNIKKAKDPWIYHHKWLMVDDSYTGFDVQASKRRTELWTSIEDIDKSKIGKLSYWNKKVVPRIPSDTFLQQTKVAFKNDEVKTANDTARTRGAVGEKALVPRVARQLFGKGDKILDFGSGPEAQHTMSLRKAGYKDVSAHEFGEHVRADVHNPKALTTKHDGVFASNVMNTQSSPEMFANTLSQILGALKVKGTFVANMPPDPRKGFLKKMTPVEARDYLRRKLEDNFHEVTTARLDNRNRPEVFIAKRKRKIPLKIKNDAQFQQNMPTFKRWFGKSVVKDPDGQPTIMFHGTMSTIKEFDIIRDVDLQPPKHLMDKLRALIKHREALKKELEIRPGVINVVPRWTAVIEEISQTQAQINRATQGKIPRKQVAFFTESPSYAGVYAKGQWGGNVMPVFLKAEKPVDIGNVDDRVGVDTMAKRFGVKLKDFPTDFVEAVKGRRQSLWVWWTEYPEVLATVRKKYDSIIGIEAGSKMVAVFNKNQIKSIFNRGTYDVHAADISMSIKKQKWYSQLEQVLESKLPGKGTGASYLQTINAWAKKGMFKAEEWEWSGLPDILEHTKKTKYDKVTIMELLAENNIRVEETVLGSPADTFEFRERVGDMFRSDAWDFLEEMTADGEDALEAAINDYVYREDADAMRRITGEFPMAYDLETLWTQAYEEMREEGEVARHADYTVEGGEKYRELLIQLPTLWWDRYQKLRSKMKSKYGEDWETSMDPEELSLAVHMETMSDRETNYIGPDTHFGDTPNILAFVRFNERQDAEGRKTLFIEEIQSDWHQEGFKSGYTGAEAEAFKVINLDDPGMRERFDFVAPGTKFVAIDEHGVLHGFGESKEAAIASAKINDNMATVPNAPYKKTWPMLAMKRMVRWAAENDFDLVAWTPGDVQKERYNLQKHLSEIRYRKNRNDGKWKLRFYGVDGERINLNTSLNVSSLSDKELESMLGKGLSDRLRGGEGTALEDDYKSLTGEDLAVGGAAMNSFYDRQLVNEANKIFNKPAWGKSKVGVTEITDVYVASNPNYQGPDIKLDSKEMRNLELVYLDYVAQRKALKEIARQMKANKISFGNAITGYAITNPELNHILSDIAVTAGGHLFRPDMEAWALPVTPEMKEKALIEGMPKFSVKDIRNNRHSTFLRNQLNAVATPEALEAIGLNERGVPYWHEYVDRRSGKDVPLKIIKKEYEELYGKLRNVKIGAHQVAIGTGKILVPKFSVKAWHGAHLTRQEDQPASKVSFATKKSQDQIAQDYVDMLESSQPGDVITAPKPAINPLDKAPESVRIGIEKNRGLPQTPFLKKMKMAAIKTRDFFLRHRPYLDPKTQGDILNVLRIHQEVPENARRRAMEVLDNILEGLNKNQYNTFTLAIIMDDMMKDLESGILSDQEGLPFGFKDRKEAKAYRDYIFDLVKKDRMIDSALRRRQQVNRKLKQILVKYDLLKEDVLEDDRYFHHQVMEYREANSLGEQFGLTTGTAAKRVQRRKQGWQKARTGSIKDYNTEYAEAEFEVLAQAFSQLESMETLNRLKAMADQTEAVKAVAKEAGLAKWEDAIPAGFTQWSPAPGSVWYKANSITDRLLHQVMSGETVLTADNVEEVMGSTWVKGRDPRWVITDGLAKTLNEFGAVGDDHAFSRASRFAMSMWKKWILINPFRVIKYNLNNWSGDLDIALAYDPRILKYYGKAMKDLWRDYRKKDIPTDIRKELEQAKRLGVTGSGWSVQEISDVTRELSFNNFMAMMDGDKPNLAQQLMRSPKVFWKTSKDITAWRENILRLAAFRYFKDRVAAGETNVYGASNQVEVDQIKNDVERAAKLSRDLIGDYGNISHAGQWIRAHMIPFYAWLEVNAPRYVRLMRNLKHEKKSTKLLSAAVAWRGTKLAIKASMLMFAVQLFNRLAFPDEEDELTESQRRQQHIILGRRADGSVRTLRFQGALSDALAWFGLENPFHDIENLIKGKVTAKEQLIESGKAPFIKLISGTRPDVKVLGEALTGETLYPDPFSPRPIRDRIEHVARMFSMDSLYRIAVGKPRRGDTAAKRLANDITRLAVYGSDPGEGAYYQTKAWMYKYLDRNDIERSSAKPTNRANAMYYYRQALKFGDLPAAERYLKKYYELGGTYKGMQQSIKRAHPLAGMTSAQRSQFLRSLNERQREVIDIATAWYYRTYVRGQRAVPTAKIIQQVRRARRKNLRELRGQ